MKHSTFRKGGQIDFWTTTTKNCKTKNLDTYVSLFFSPTPVTFTPYYVCRLRTSLPFRVKCCAALFAQPFQPRLQLIFGLPLWLFVFISKMPKNVKTSDLNLPEQILHVQQQQEKRQSKAANPHIWHLFLKKFWNDWLIFQMFAAAYGFITAAQINLNSADVLSALWQTNKQSFWISCLVDHKQSLIVHSVRFLIYFLKFLLLLDCQRRLHVGRHVECVVCPDFVGFTLIGVFVLFFSLANLNSRKTIFFCPASHSQPFHLKFLSLFSLIRTFSLRKKTDWNLELFIIAPSSD